MQNLYNYLAIFLGVKLLLIIFFGLIIFKEQLKFRRIRALTRRHVPREDFYCVKNTLKQMNDHFYVAQIVFTNKKNCTLTTHSETPHHLSEEEE
jgi:hypothetical protein